MTIMVVDDQADVRETVADIVRMVMKHLSYDATVLEADNAEEASNLVKLRKYKLDVLVTDMDMPGKNGLELAEAMKVPTIILTGNPLSAEVKRPANIVAELLKPLKSRELLPALKAALAA